MSPTSEESYAPAWRHRVGVVHSGSSSLSRELGSATSPPRRSPLTPSEGSCSRTSRSTDSRAEGTQSSSDLRRERQLDADVRRQVYQRVCELPVRLMAGMLPNRDYYPLPHHQLQFDALASHDGEDILSAASLPVRAM
jgi:hypothetical protein